MNKLSFYLSIVHLLFALWISWVIATGNDSEASMLWAVLFVLDFPISYGYILLADLAHGIGVSKFIFEASLEGRFSDFYNIILPTFYFVIVGTAWWFLLPRLVVRLIGRMKLYLTRQ